MAGNEGSMAKICSTCGTDCTNKPRVKDASGNYMCKPCAEKAAGAKPSPRGGAAKVAAAPASEPNIMAKLVDDSLKQAQGACPACRKKLKEGALICTNCGFNSTTGQMVQTAVQTPQLIVDKSAKKMRSRTRVHMDGSILVLVAMVLIGGAVLMSVVAPEMALVGVLLCGVFSVVLYFLTIITAFKDDQKMWGIICIIIPFTGGISGLALLYYLFMVTERGYLKWLWVTIFLGTGASVVMLIANAPPEALNTLPK